MALWTCVTCGVTYALSTPREMTAEKSKHGEDKCGKKTSQQRVSINTLNLIQKEKVRSETFAETLERIVVEAFEKRKERGD